MCIHVTVFNIQTHYFKKNPQYTVTTVIIFYVLIWLRNIVDGWRSMETTKKTKMTMTSSFVLGFPSMCVNIIRYILQYTLKT